MTAVEELVELNIFVGRILTEDSLCLIPRNEFMLIFSILLLVLSVRSQ